MNKNSKHNEEENFDFLDQLSKNEEFKVPGGYFDKMKDEIYSKTINTKIIDGKGRFDNNLTKKVLYGLSIAAAMVIGFFILNNDSTRTEECKTFACLLEETTLTAEDIEYMEEASDGIFGDDDYFY